MPNEFREEGVKAAKKQYSSRKNEVLQSTWLTLSDREKEIFYDRYLKRMRLDVDSDGNARIVMGA